MSSPNESSGRVEVILSLLPEVAERVEKARQLLEAKDYEEVFRIGFLFLEWYLMVRQLGESLFRGRLEAENKLVGRIVTLDNL